MQEENEQLQEALVEQGELRQRAEEHQAKLERELVEKQDVVSKLRRIPMKRKKENERLKSELRTNKRLKTLAQNKIKEMRPVIDEQRKQLDTVKSDAKTIILYREEISRIGTLRSSRDRLSQR